MTESSRPEIGRRFGGKRHTATMHSIAKINEDRWADMKLNQTPTKLMETLG